MTKEEFVRERAELVIEDLINHWGVQSRKHTHFIYTPMAALSDFISILNDDLDNGIEIYDEDEFDDEDSPFPEEVYQECLEEIMHTYNAVIEARKPYEFDE